MPTPESMVQFKAGLQAAFDKIQSKDLNTVYFVTDTQRLFVGETEYSRPVSYGSALPSGYLPPNSLFVVKGSGTRDLFFSKDGASWEPIAHINEAVLNTDDKTIGIINAKAYGSATKVPVITVDSKGAITAISEQDISFPQVEVPDVEIASGTGTGNVIASLEADGHTITPTLFNAVAANSNITASSSPSIVQYDSKGLVTSGTVAGSAATKNVATQAIGTQATDDLVTGNQVKTYVDTAVADLSGAMHFVGMFEDLPEADSYDPGDVCVVGNKEYVLVEDDSTKEWRELGDESIYAVKGSIVNSDISATAAIDQSKIAGTLGNNENLAADISELNSGKVAKVTSAIANHITVFGAGGAIADGGVAISDLATAASVTALTGRVGTAEGDINDLQAVTVAGKALSGDITIALGDLSNVTGSPTTGQSLVFNGTSWAPGAPDAGSVSWANVTGKPSIAVTGGVTGTLDLSAGTPTLVTTLRALTNTDIPTGITASKVSGALSNATIGAADVTAGTLGTDVIAQTTTTASAGDNSTNIASTAFVKQAVDAATLVWGHF